MGDAPVDNSLIVSQKKEDKGLLLVFIFAALFIMELLLRIYIYPNAWQWDALCYIALFSLVYACLLRWVSSLFSQAVNYALLLVLMLGITILMEAQYIYYLFFKRPLLVYSIFNGAQIAEFSGDVLNMILKHLPQCLSFLLPCAGVLLWAWGRCQHLRFLPGLRLLLLALISYLICMLMIFFSGTAVAGAYNTYYNDNNPAQSQALFGSLTELRLDAQRSWFGFSPRDLPVSTDVEQGGEDSTDTDTLPAPEYAPNMLTEIDFDTLIAQETDRELRSMHEYFYSLKPSSQNEYTGMFAGKNLIYITAEGFSHYLIGQELFPTVTRLATEGFEFTNMYTPLWNVSTSDGEYVNVLGLLPKSGVWSLARSSENYLPFALGNQFSALGYRYVLAYHNHSYTYYDRHLSHPNLGYDFRAPEHGLSITEIWPESDLEMMQNSVSDYLDAEGSSFHIYYMTVSGHLEYSFTGNNMAARHYDAVQQLPYSDEVKAYLACNLELEYALAYLLQALEAAGQLENTVIVLASDHYPYGLSMAGLEELAGQELDSNFDLYRNGLIIWQADVAHQIIDEPVSSMDILPTVSNLFGLSYDSRLLMGRDIFDQDSQPLVIFNNRSWITDKASYNAETGEICGAVSEAYVTSIHNMVSAKFTFSAKVLERDYYRVLLNE